jgi:hypothetical protein
MAKKKISVLPHEVNKLLPELDKRFSRIFQIHWQLKILISEINDQELILLKIDEIEKKLDQSNDSFEQLDDLTSIKVLLEAIDQEINWLKLKGIKIKNLFRGEVLIPSLIKNETREIMWKFGNTDVYWNEKDESKINADTHEVLS